MTDDTKSVVNVLAMTDILISVNCPSLTKMVFMLPGSALLLSQPPGLKDYRFKNLALSMGFVYKHLRTSGHSLRECDDSVYAKACVDAVSVYSYMIPPVSLSKSISYALKQRK